MVERRRTPRVELMTHEKIRLEQRHRVQLLDISQSGVLVSCEAPVPVGARAQFRTGLASLPFHAEVAVKRHHPRAARAGRTGLGAQFTALDDRSRQHLDQFLRKAKD